MPLFGPPNIEKLKAKHDVEGLVKALTHKKDLVRISAVEALGEIGGTRAVEPLITTLDHRRETNGAARERAAMALGKIGDARAVEPLIAALNYETHPWTRQHVAEALAKFGDARAVEPLIDALREVRTSSQTILNRAAAALGKIGFPAIEPLIAALTAEPNVSPSTIEELRELGDTRTGGTDDDEKVHQIVAKAAKELADVFTEKESRAKTEEKAARERTTVCAKCGRTRQSILADFERMKNTPGVYFIGGPALLWCDDCEVAFCGVCQVDLGLDSGCPRCRKELSSVPSSA